MRPIHITLTTVCLSLACASGQRPAVPPPPLAPLVCPPGTTAKQLPRPPSSWCETTGGVRYGPSRLLHDNGQPHVVGNIAHGKRDGLWRTTLADGTVASEEHYRAGVRHGPAVHWQTATVKMWEGSMVNGQLDGPSRQWHRNGTVASEGTYKLGKKTGAWRSWWPGGKRASEGGFANGQKTGAWKYFHQNGRPAAHGDYDADAKIRAWKFLDDQGGVSLNWTPPKPPHADGQSCSIGDDCQSGACTGVGCEPGDGTCVPKERMCTEDVVAYIACDGRRFVGSSTCPGGRHTGGKPPDRIRRWDFR